MFLEELVLPTSVFQCRIFWDRSSEEGLLDAREPSTNHHIYKASDLIQILGGMWNRKYKVVVGTNLEEDGAVWRKGSEVK